LRRAELLLLLCVALGGCMKIYPDPELPDIEVFWYVDQCKPGSGDVLVVLDGIDDPAVHVERSVPCMDAKLEFADVARERYRVTGTLLDAAGTPLGGGSQPADLRNGFSTSVGLSFANVRIAFEFDPGVTCDSLDATRVGAWIRLGDEWSPLAQSDCDAGEIFAFSSPGMFTLAARALDEEFRLVAAAAPAEVEVATDGLTNVGPLTLVPCDGACPLP
jgi:hypothetical protein